MEYPKPKAYSEWVRWAESLVSFFEWQDETKKKVPEVGQVGIFAVALPEGWLPADGSEFVRAAHPRLGTLFGETFGVPSAAHLCVLPDWTSPFADSVVGIWPGD